MQYARDFLDFEEADMLHPGIYEQTISQALRGEIANASDTQQVSEEGIDAAEASRILSAYVEKAVRRSLDGVSGKNALQRQVQIVNSLIRNMADSILPEDPELGCLIASNEVDAPAKQLLSVVDKQNSVGQATGRASGFVRPDTSVARTSLFTGSAHEPQLYTELRKEIESADQILMLVSFIKWSGLCLIMDELRTFIDRGGTLRVITTSYMGATDPKAVLELAKLPRTQVKISYDTTGARLHAKAYVFQRDTGFTTAYIGSSNLSNPAMTRGLEWNVKISRVDQPDTLNKVEATFETYWNSLEFEDYSPDDQDRLVAAIRHERGRDSQSKAGALSYSFDINPYSFQQRILDKLQSEREVHGCWRNLVVAATGTGKTVIAAFDYRNYCKRYNGGRPARLLFVAHRKEILEQSIACFRGILHDQNFGDLFVGAYNKPGSLDHLFVSIQTINSRSLTRVIAPDYYDYIVVDEIHHGAADSYQALLGHFTPKVLLGLTATPERADGKSILPWFDNRVAAEIRLPEAIDRKLLCPFSYFGVTDDTVDLKSVKWSRGGYDESDLERVYVFETENAKRRAQLVARSVEKYVTDVSEVHGLGFCVSKAHARFMAAQFSQFGIPSVALTSDTSDEDREAARSRLAEGSIKFIFTVDLFNEGVDIPEIDTVLFLRPTQSLTVFLQQLGRGLRLSEGKECLTVLDFIGEQNRRFDFQSRFQALLEQTNESMESQVRHGFTAAPKGCYIHLERIAQQHVLDNIRDALGRTSAFVAAIRTFEEDSGKPFTLANFVRYYHLDVRDIYKRASFSRLCVEAGVRENFQDPDETVLAKAFLRFCSIDSRHWIDYLLACLRNPQTLDWGVCTPRERRMLNMFQITIWPNSFKDDTFANAAECVCRVCENRVLSNELCDLLELRKSEIDFVDEEVDLGFDCPLSLHCQYTRDQIFVAMDRMDPQNVREGVSYIKDKAIDVLVNTLNKSEKEYSPSTMYEDYSINETLFHWQSQNKTSADSTVGRRYVSQWDEEQHRKTRVALFVREYNRDSFGTQPYTFLGLVDYVSHSGSRPMTIIWRLRRPIPAKFLPKTNKLAS